MVSPFIRTPIAIIAEKGVFKGAFEELEEVCGEEAVGSGVVRSVKDAEDSRSVTAEMGPVGLFEDSICEDVYILGRRGQSAIQADIGRRGGDQRPLHSERQFIAARYVLNHYVLFFDARSQQ